jgi:hypothetical protein
VTESHNEDSRSVSTRAAAEAIRGSALGLLVGGGVCLYFGFTLLIDAPGSASEEAVQTWFAADRAFRWCLRIAGVAFLLAAAWAATGQRSSMLLAVPSELVFALLMLAMSIETTLEARADGQWDVFAILLLILLVMGLAGARRSWELYVVSGHLPRSPTDDNG